MANSSTNYTIPLGIDTKGLFSDIQEISKGVDILEAEVTGASKAMQDGFAKTVAAGEKVQATFKDTVESARLLKDAAKTMGKELGEALGSKDFETRVKKFQELIGKVKGSKINMDIQFNEATIRELQKGLKGASAEIEHFKTLVAAAKVQLASLDPDTDEFRTLAEQIAITEGFMEGLGEATEQVEFKSKSLKAQLRLMKEELALMEEQGLESTAAFEKLSIEAGKLEDQIGDTAQRVRVLASDTKHIDAAIQGVTGLVGAMTAAQGAEALFGTENEELARSIQKVTAAMAILQGIQAVAQALNKDSALSILFLRGARQADTVAAGAQTAATTAQATATEGATVATNGLTAALLRNPITLVVVAIVAAVAALYQFTKGSEDAKAATDDLNRSLEDQQKILDLDIAALKRRTDLRVAELGLMQGTEQEIIKVQGRSLQDQMNLNLATLEENRRKLNSIEGFGKEEVEQRKKLNEAIQKGEAFHNDIVGQINLKGVEQDKQRLEDAKKAREQYIQFVRQATAAELEARGENTIKQRADKQRAQARAEINQRIQDLQKELSLTAENEEKKNQAIAALRKLLTKRLADIARDEARELAALQLSGAKMLLDLAKEGVDDAAKLRELELNEISLNEQEKLAIILESYRGQKVLQDFLIQANADAAERKRKEVNLKFAIEEAKNQEQLQIAALEIAYGFKDLPARVEQAKQEDILRVQIKFAEIRLQQLKDSGKKETDLVVVMAIREVEALKGALDKAIKGGKRYTSLFDLLGLEAEGGLTPAQVSAIQQGTQAIITAYKQVTDFLIQSNQAQIKSSSEKVQAFQNEIDTLEGTLKKEQELRRKGYANTAEQAEKDLAAKKAQQDEEIRNRKELFEKQKEIQRQQLIVDTISQGSSLITASANVLEGFSTIPVVGPILGAIAVAAMIAGFIASKAAAFRAVNNQQSFGEGGTIDGKPHSAGGTKYYNPDGSVVELEAGEEVTRKTMSDKYRPLLKAINNDQLAYMSDESLAALLKGTGVSFQTDIPEEAENASQAYDTAKSVHFIATGGKAEGGEDIKAIREGVEYLADRKKTEVETWEDENFRYERKGNKTTKIRKA